MRQTPDAAAPNQPGGAVPLDKVIAIFTEIDCSWLGQGLHSVGDMDGDSIGLTFVDRPHKLRLGNDQPGMQTDPNSCRSVCLPCFGLNGQCSLTCQQGVPLLDMWRTKECHYTVAQCVDDGPTETLHRSPHERDSRRQTPHCLFRIKF